MHTQTYTFLLFVVQPRLKCLIHIVKQLNEEHKDFITALLPEVAYTHTLQFFFFLYSVSQDVYKAIIVLYQVIICTKEVSVGARKNAYSLLVEMGNAFIRFCGNTKG